MLPHVSHAHFVPTVKRWTHEWRGDNYVSNTRVEIVCGINFAWLCWKNGRALVDSCPTPISMRGWGGSTALEMFWGNVFSGGCVRQPRCFNHPWNVLRVLGYLVVPWGMRWGMSQNCQGIQPSLRFLLCTMECFFPIFSMLSPIFHIKGGVLSLGVWVFLPSACTTLEKSYIGRYCRACPFCWVVTVAKEPIWFQCLCR